MLVAHKLKVLHHSVHLHLSQQYQRSKGDQVESQQVEEGVCGFLFSAEVGESDHGGCQKSNDGHIVHHCADAFHQGLVHLVLLRGLTLLCHFYVAQFNN